MCQRTRHFMEPLSRQAWWWWIQRLQDSHFGELKVWIVGGLNDWGVHVFVAGEVVAHVSAAQTTNGVSVIAISL